MLSAVFTSILFVQEEILTFIPNVQFTFLLITLYGATMGLKWGSLIVLAHVLLDNLFMGSFIPTVIIPMYIGYEFTLLFGYLTRGKNIWLIAVLCSLSIIIYTQAFAITNVLFYKVNYGVYMVSDIPFTVLLIIFSSITIIWLYKPLYKIINNLENYNN